VRKNIEFKLANKAWACKKKIPTSFPNHLLKNAWIESAFPYALSPHHEGTKWDTIGVTRGIMPKLPHCMGPTLIYLMENEMPFVHHAIE
jgi:hypothetical protein